MKKVRRGRIARQQLTSALFHRRPHIRYQKKSFRSLIRIVESVEERSRGGSDHRDLLALVVLGVCRRSVIRTNERCDFLRHQETTR